MTKGDLAQAISDLEAVAGKVPKGKPPSARTTETATVALGAVHADLEAFWAWGKIEALAGASRIAEEREASEASWAQVWLSPASSLSTLRDLRAEVPKFPASFVPVATDEAGNYTCFDNATGRLVDWDHETRKTKKLADGLPKLLQAIRAAYVAAAKREASDAADRAEQKREKAAASKPRPAKGSAQGETGGASTALPKSLKPVGAPILRKTEDRLHEYEDGILSPDATRAVLRQVSQQTTFLHLANDTREHPAIDELAEHIRMFGSADRPFSEGLAVDPSGARFALASREEISLWRWEEKGVALVGRASWHDAKRKAPQFRAADLRQGGRVWLTDTHLAVSIDRADTTGGYSRSYGFDSFGESVVAVWRCADLPGDTALSTKPKSVAPAFIVAAGIPHLKGFAMAGDRVLTVHTAEDYLSAELRLWELGREAPLATKTVESGVSRVALRSDGQRCAYLGDTLTVLDTAFAPVAKATKKDARELGETLLYDPTGRLLVTASTKELVVWEAETARIAVSTPIADPKQKVGHRRHFVKHVTRDRVLVLEPTVLFAMK